VDAVELMIRQRRISQGRRQDEDVLQIDGLITKELKMEDGLGVALHVRPGLHDYLRELAEVADVYAFTSAMSVYARPVINYLDPEKSIFQNVWYRESCTQTSAGNHWVFAKDLETLKHEYDPNRTVLVDNNVFSFIPQLQNGILVPAFHDDPKDDALPQVLKLVKELRTERDVKPVLHDLFDIQGQIQSLTKR
jgi:Dullard-like phosphatase family protein